MPVNSTHSKGIELQIGDGGSPESFSLVGGLRSVPAIPAVKSTVEDSAISDDNYHYIHGIGEPPAVSLPVVFDATDAQQSAMIAEYDNETESNYRVVAPDSGNTTYEFKAIVTGYSAPYGGINELLMQDFEIQLVENDSGEIVTKQ